MCIRDSIAADTVGDPVLGTVQHPLLPFLLSGGGHAHGVAAGAGLGERPSAEPFAGSELGAVSYTHLRAHETVLDLVCRLLLEKKKHEITDQTQDTI